MKPDSIILDIDGTLWNSTPIVAEAWNKAVLQKTGIQNHFTAQKLTQLFGHPLTKIADLSFPFLEEAERYALMDLCCEQEHIFLSAADEDLLYPEVANTIPLLSQKYPLFIVSNCQAGYIELFLEKTGLAPYITDFECPGNTGLNKGPNIQLVIKRNHLTSPIYVGDIPSDQAASKEAQIPFCHATYGFSPVEAPDYKISLFSDLLTLFE